MLEDLLINEITLKRPTYGNDASGGVTTTLATVGTYAASVQPVSDRVALFYAQRNVVVSMQVFVQTPDLQNADGTINLRRGDIITDGPLTYQVNGWREQAGRGVVLAIDCDSYNPGD